MAHAFNPSTSGGRGSWISEFKANLIYTASSRTARPAQRNPVSKKKKKKKIKNQDLALRVNPSTWKAEVRRI
jgi:hypothetical protein